MCLLCEKIENLEKMQPKYVTNIYCLIEVISDIAANL
jgi:hypothetical protein